MTDVEARADRMTSRKDLRPAPLADLLTTNHDVASAFPSSVPSHAIEAWCNRVAAGLLVPLRVLREEFRAREDLPVALARLARRFKVSTLVVLRRIHDLGAMDDAAFRTTYQAERARLLALPAAASSRLSERASDAASAEL